MLEKAYKRAGDLCMYRKEGLKQTLHQIRGVYSSNPVLSASYVNDTEPGHESVNLDLADFKDIVHLIDPHEDTNLTKLWMYSEKSIFVCVYNPLLKWLVFR